MLKTKAGEVIALENLTPAVKARVFPVFHVTTSVSPRFAPGMGTAWGGRQLAVDGTFNFNNSGSVAAFTALIRSLRQNNVGALPAVTYPSDPRLVAAAAGVIGPSGLVVKSSLTALPTVGAWILAQGWQPAQIDLVIDLVHIAGLPTTVLAPVVVTALNQSMGNAPPYRSVTLGSAAAPKDHGDLPRGRSNVPRRDWQLWQAVHPVVPFQLDYGDYAVGHPDLTEPPGVAMANATVSARYTAGDEWIVIKGRATRGAHGLPMPQQYLAHANQFLGDPQFGGLIGCWADARIAQIVAGGASPGNRQSWSEIGVNRHISVVESQLP
jgi:Beta protein